MNSIFVSLFVILALANGDGNRSLLQRQSILFSAQAADNAGPGWIVYSLPSLHTSIAPQLIKHYLPSLHCKQRATTQRSKSKSAVKSISVLVLTSGDGNHLLLQGRGVLLPAQTAAVAGPSVYIILLITLVAGAHLLRPLPVAAPILSKAPDPTHANMRGAKLRNISNIM